MTAGYSPLIYTIDRNSVGVSALTSLKLLEVQASNLEGLITTPW